MQESTNAGAGPRRSRFLLLVLATLLGSQHVQAAERDDCAPLRQEIATKIEANGVRS